jgi:hypothetical protein
MHFQRLIQTEADLMRLEEVHSSLFNEHKNLQEDYERIHIYVEVSYSKDVFRIRRNTRFRVLALKGQMSV